MVREQDVWITTSLFLYKFACSPIETVNSRQSANKKISVYVLNERKLRDVEMILIPVSIPINV